MSNTTKKKLMFYKSLYRPEYLSLVSFGIFFVAWITPPDTYDSIINEPSIIFGDAFTFFYVSTLTITYWIGCKIKTIKIKVSEKEKKLSKWQLRLPLIFSNILTAIVGYIYIRENLLLIAINLIGNAGQIKGEAEIPQLMMPILYGEIAVLYWYYFEKRKSAKEKIKFDALEWFGIIAIFLISLLLVSRYLIIPFIVGISMIKYRNERVNSFNILMGVGIIIFIFSALGMLRGGDVIHQIYGYGPASFNRLTVLLHGMASLDEIEPLRYIASTLGEVKDTVDILYTEHSIVSSAGLDGGLNWFTVYGYVHAAIGFFSYAYFFVLGLISKVFYSSFYSNRLIGIVTYPWLATTIIFWFSFNMLAWGTTVIFLLSALILSLYTKIKINFAS